MTANPLDSVGVRLTEIEFQMSRSSGPGGQNVNKVNSKVTLRWRMAESAIDPGVKRRFAERYGGRITQGGEVIVQSDEFRDQSRNKEACLERLAEMIRTVLRPPKKRKKTKPSKGAKERRLGGKKKRSEVKSMRGKFRE